MTNNTFEFMRYPVQLHVDNAWPKCAAPERLVAKIREFMIVRTIVASERFDLRPECRYLGIHLFELHCIFSSGFPIARASLL